MQIDIAGILDDMGVTGETIVTGAGSHKAPLGRPRTVPPGTGYLAPGPKKQFELTKLQAVHHEILRLKLAGMKHVEIAAALNISKQVVLYTVNSSLGSQKLELMIAAKDCDSIDFAKRMQELLPAVADLYEKTIKDENADLGLRIKTATTVAKDFAGQAAPTRIDARHVHAHLTSEQIEEVKRRGMQQALDAGMLAESSPDVIDMEV